MIRLWLLRIARGCAASCLLAAVLGGWESAAALHAELTQQIPVSGRALLWALGVAWSVGLGLVLALPLSAASSALFGHGEDDKALALDTGRDPMHPWLPLVLLGTAGPVLAALFLPRVVAAFAAGDVVAWPGVTVVLAGALLVFHSGRRALLRYDHTGRGKSLILWVFPSLLGLSLAVALPAGAGRGSAPSGERGAARGPGVDVVLVTVDGLRLDHVDGFARDARGQPLPGRVATPSLERLAGEGALLGELVTASSAELPAAASLMTGRHPFSLSLLGDWQRLPARVGNAPLRTLAERLQASGWATGAFVGSAGLDGVETGLRRGFQVYDDGFAEGLRGAGRLALPAVWGWLGTSGGRLLPLGAVLRPAGELIDRWRSWRDAVGGGARSFSWLHLVEPRLPALGGLRGSNHSESLRNPIAGEEGAAYARAVVAADAALGALLAEMTRRDSLEQTWLVVAATRGAIPGARPGVGEPWIRVPAVVRAPGIPRGTRWDGPSRLHDLTATLLEVAGLSPDPGGDGTSLLDSLRGQPLAAGPVPQTLLLGPPQGGRGLCPVALRAVDWKIVRSADGRESLYILSEDPGERHDRSEERRGALESAQAGLDETLGGFVPELGPPRTTPGRAARLRTLEAAW
jgi:arylsulfatase A-like enzyme